MTDLILDQVVQSYMKRVAVRPGNGLTRSMNHQLRCYPAIPEILRRTAAWLIRAEQTFQFSGVAIRTMHLYWDLVKAHDDWGIEVPVLHRPSLLGVLSAVHEGDDVELAQVAAGDHPALAGAVQFERRALLPYQQYVAAMAVGRRIGLLGGHGRIGLDPVVRRAAQQALAAVRAG